MQVQAGVAARGILRAPMKDLIRWGILGCGDVTEVKSGPALARAEGSALVAVMRRTPHLAEDYARRHGVPRWFESAQELIRDPDVDAVYIAAPPGAHLELALAVAAAGKPAYVEKPMARSHAECHRMNQAFAAAGVPLFVAYYRRALPRFLRVQALIAEGRIGRPASLAYRYARPRQRTLVGGSCWTSAATPSTCSTGSSGRSARSRAMRRGSGRSQARSRTWSRCDSGRLQACSARPCGTSRGWGRTRIGWSSRGRKGRFASRCSGTSRSCW